MGVHIHQQTQQQAHPDQIPDTFRLLHDFRYLWSQLFLAMFLTIDE